MTIITVKTASCPQDGSIYKNIPDELKAAALWCCYRLEPDLTDPAKKPHKIPYNPMTGHKAKVNDVGTLMGFNEAVAGVVSGSYDGINRAFGHDEYVGVDLDNVLDSGTGEFTCEKAEEIFQHFKKGDAYVEVSPSETGLRIICKGVSPALKFGKGIGEYAKFEMYGKGLSETTNKDCFHFLSFTGHASQAVDGIPECPLPLMRLYRTYFKRPEVTQERAESGLENSPPLSDDEIIEKVRQSKIGADFARLFEDGSIGDHSSDDLRLCSMLVVGQSYIVGYRDFNFTLAS